MKAVGLYDPPMQRSLDERPRAHHPLYRPTEKNHCPGCGRSQWLVGRKLAECAFCSTALPIAGGQPWGCYP